jgi:hypothetical protein
MPFFPREEREIINESLERLDRDTNINQMAPGGKARFFLSTTAREQAKQQRLFDENLLQPYIHYAEGRFLDFFGDMLNVPRLEAAHAIAEDDNLMFYVDSGTFGDINNGAAISIPAGTSVSTESFSGEIVTPGIAEQPVVSYSTLVPVTGEADTSFVYAPVRSALEGIDSSVPRNVLNVHGFNSYTLSDTQRLKCTNRYAIDNGVDREEDESYRYRLSNVFRSRTMAVMASIRLAALAIPGVADVYLVNAEQGPGTFALYIKGITPTVSPDLIREVTQSVNLVTGYGIRPFISAPRPLGLELVAAVNWSPRAKAEEIAFGYVAMREAVEEVINALDIGEDIEMVNIIDSMLEAAPLAYRIGRNRPNKFEEIYLHKASPTGEGSVRTLTFGEWLSPLYNERIILETSGRYRGIQFITF